MTATHTLPAPESTPPADTAASAAWHARADELARWMMRRLVNRTDRCGKYFTHRETGRTRSCTDPADANDARVGFLTHQRLVRHCSATTTGDIVAAHSYGPDEHGKWVGIDVDNHADEADPEANRRFALHVYQLCHALGFASVLLYESNGRGGFHLWVLLDGPVPAWLLHRFGRWLVHDWAEFGFAKEPEVFPKQEGGKPWGSFMRLPGRHHTRPVWARVWDGAAWVEGGAAVAHILSLTGDPAELIPSQAGVHGTETFTGGEPDQRRPARPPDPTWVEPYEEFNRRATLDEVGDLLERHGWTRGGRPRRDGAIGFIRPGKGPRDGEGGNLLKNADGVPIFFVFTDGGAPLEPGRGYAPSALLALLEHGGDFKASNQWLRDQGYGSRITVRGGDGERHQDQPAIETPSHGASVRPTAGEASELVVESLGGVRPKPVLWLVPGYVPAGMMGLFAGDGGRGKTQTTLELAAAVTTGRCAFGLSYPDPPRGKVLLIACEDDWERTTVPRLAALGADLTQVLRVRGVRKKTQGGRELLDFHLGHFRELENLLVAHPDIRLAAIDPAGSYISRSGVNENHDSELRSILSPLSEMTNRTGVTVILIKHLNKSAGASAVQRVSGSTGYVNSCRFAFLFAADPDDPERHLMVPIKTNILPAGTRSLAYRMAPLPPDDARVLLLRVWPDLPPADVAELAKQLFRQHWEGATDADPNRVAAGGDRKKKTKTAEDATGWVAALFGEPNVCYPSAAIFEAGEKAGFGRDSIYQAKDVLKGRIGLRVWNGGQLGGVWHWGVGPPAAWVVRSTIPPTNHLLACKEVQEVQEEGSSGSSGSTERDPELPELPELTRGRVLPDTASNADEGAI